MSWLNTFAEIYWYSILSFTLSSLSFFKVKGFKSIHLKSIGKPQLTVLCRLIGGYAILAHLRFFKIKGQRNIYTIEQNTYVWENEKFPYYKKFLIWSVACLKFSKMSKWKVNFSKILKMVYKISHHSKSFAKIKLAFDLFFN